jgi:hypothetical protein
MNLYTSRNKHICKQGLLQNPAKSCSSTFVIQIGLDMNTSQILPECLPLKADVFAVSIEKCRFFDDYLKTPLDLNNINYLCLGSYSSSSIIHNNIIYKIHIT